MAGKCSVSELHPQTVDSLFWIRLDVHHSQLRQTSTPQETQDPVHGHPEDRWQSHGICSLWLHPLLSLVCVRVRRTGRRSREESRAWDPGRDTWGLQQRSNELRVDEPQDRVDRPNPAEVDVTEVVAQLCCKLHAFLVALHLGNEKSEGSPGRVPSQSLPTTPNSLTPSTRITNLWFLLSHPKFIQISLTIFNFQSTCLFPTSHSLHFYVSYLKQWLDESMGKYTQMIYRYDTW